MGSPTSQTRLSDDTTQIYILEQILIWPAEVLEVKKLCVLANTLGFLNSNLQVLTAFFFFSDVGEMGLKHSSKLLSVTVMACCQAFWHVNSTEMNSHLIQFVSTIRALIKKHVILFGNMTNFYNLFSSIHLIQPMWQTLDFRIGPT